MFLELKLVCTDMKLYVLRYSLTSTYRQLTSNTVTGDYDMQKDPDFCPRYYRGILQNIINMLHSIFIVNTILVLSIYKI